MSPYVVIVDFRLQSGSLAAFRPMMDRNARLSVTRETGCRRFDVVEPEGGTDRIVLYEIYDDRSAFDAHLRMQHYIDFDAESAPLVASKTVTTGVLVCEG